MNLTKKTILALGFLAVAGASYAQTATSANGTPTGLLGQSYSEVSFGVSDIKHYSKDQNSLGVSANVPITPYLDVGAGYSYDWFHAAGHSNTINSTATAFTTYNGVKPFVGVGLGYQWQTWQGGRDNQAVWAGAVGVEIPVYVVTLTPRIVYSDDFRNASRSTQQTSYGVEANYWVTKTTAAFAGVDYVDVRNSSRDAWTYTVGARFKF